MTLTDTLKVLVVDDHPLMAQATKQLLEQIDGLEVIDIAFDGRSCLLLVESERPDLVFLDYQLPDMVATDITEKIKAEYPHIHVVIFTGVDVAPFINKLLGLRISGVISKGTRHSSIKHMIACILDQHIVLPRSTLQEVRLMPAEDGDPDLTEDEILIMKLIVKGATLDQIASQIHVSKRSVDNYQRRIYEKFGAATRVQAIEKFVRSKYYYGEAGETE